MFVIITDNNLIQKYELSSGVNYKGITIYNKHDNYYIDLKTGYYFEDNSKSKKLEIDKHVVKNDKTLYNIYIYVYENNEGINKYELYKLTSFIIANNSSANIVCNDRYLKNNYLSYNDGHLKSNFDVYVNHIKYTNGPLKQGDIIEYLGIRIIYFNEFIYINGFNIDIKLPKYNIVYSSIKYKPVNKFEHFYIPENIHELVIDDIKEYEEIKKPNNKDFIKSIIPNLIMCLSMGLMAYINYCNNSLNTNVSIISYILMPISMLLTGIIVPFIFVLVSNNAYKKELEDNKNNYLAYLNEYELQLKDKINKYISSLNSHYFSLLDSKNKMFYASKNSIDYLKLSIGKVTTSVKVNYKLTNDEDINKRIKEIKNICDNIDGYPVYIDINEKRIVTIATKLADKNHYFYKYLLETSYKHHYDDISIAIYSKDINVSNICYNLPHLFINNRRLTLSTTQELQILDQMPLNKPLILFIYDKNQYVFTNPNIHVIYFSSDISDCLKDSDLIVEYINNTGNIYDDKKVKFKYYPEDINFNDYFRYIGRFKSIENGNSLISFNSIYNYDVFNNYNYDPHSLVASFAYNDDNLISFDLHETKQGPHGLIGGSTGSGKSELIVSLLLSLALRYSPDYLNIVLIDYKGGGIKESLSYNNQTIPHIIASLTNLNDYGLERLIIALNNECKRRQLLFKKLSDISNVSIMNLDDYIDNNVYSLDNIAHLLIVVDEFAELKKNNPEQIKELISISRIGRSLGIHLILATQKPAGVIDDEIWSNSRFKIALKVFEEKDSIDIIKTKDAAYLTNPGSFYMLVDNGLLKGQAIYSKADVYGHDLYKASILSSNLEIQKTYKKDNGKTISSSSYYCKKILDKTLNQYKYKELVFLAPKNKDRHKLTSSKCICFGEIDDYINSQRGLLAYDLKKSILIYTTRKHEINSILNCLNENCRHSIVISNDIYEGKYISDSITYDNDEDINYLFNHLMHNKNNNLTLLIEDINCLFSYDETYIEKLSKLIKRKDSLNLSIICLTNNTQISFKLINLFKTKLMIDILDNSDLSYFYGSRGQYKGKSYFYIDNPITFIPVLIEPFISQNPILANVVKSIPDPITFKTKDNLYLVGYDIHTRDPIYMNDITLISYNEELLNEYKTNYKDINTIVYRDDMKLFDKTSFIWLGSGVFNQRIFISGLKDDLKENEGILFINNRKTIIRSINNA